MATARLTITRPKLQTSTRVVTLTEKVQPPPPGMDWLLAAAGLSTTGQAAALFDDPNRWVAKEIAAALRALKRTKGSRAYRRTEKIVARLQIKNQDLLRRQMRLRLQLDATNKALQPYHRAVEKLDTMLKAGLPTKRTGDERTTTRTAKVKR